MTATNLNHLDKSIVNYIKWKGEEKLLHRNKPIMHREENYRNKLNLKRILGVQFASGSMSKEIFIKTSWKIARQYETKKKVYLLL